MSIVYLLHLLSLKCVFNLVTYFQCWNPLNARINISDSRFIWYNHAYPSLHTFSFFSHVIFMNYFNSSVDFYFASFVVLKMCVFEIGNTFSMLKNFRQHIWYNHAYLFLFTFFYFSHNFFSFFFFRNYFNLNVNC